MQQLLEHFGSAEQVLQATREELQVVPGLGPKLVAAVLAARQSSAAAQELVRCRQLQLHLLRCRAPGYPPWLCEIPDPPAILYCKGDFAARDHLAIAIVGSRRCSLYGQQQAEKFAGALARAGVTIVSGLARGIDAAAHRGALEAGGRTIGVLATGLAEIYPPEHEDLAREIANSGAIISEAPLGQAAVPGVFPHRNRIISGLSLGVLVIDAARNSGSLYTARHAMEQNREVMAIPGRIDHPASGGCHDLIRDGAQLIRCVEDVLETLGPLSTPAPKAAGGEVHQPRELLLNDQEQLVLNQLSAEPRHIDEVVRGSDLQTQRVLQTLTILEMRKLIRRLPGGNYCRS